MEIGKNLEEELVSDLAGELSATDENFRQELILPKVRNAIREVKRARKYPSSYTDEQINRDIYDFYPNIRGIALYDYNQIGAEGEQSHSENGVSRSYIDRNKLFSGIIPLSRF